MVIYQRTEEAKEEILIPRLKKKVLTQEQIIEFDNHLQHYQKPAARPEPPIWKSSGVITPDKHHREEARWKDFTWSLARHYDSSQIVPSWSAYNALLSTNNSTVCTTRYLPFINELPDNPSTIYTALLTLVDVAKKLDQKHILVTADMAIYKRAQEILWSQREELYGKVTMRIGTMHLMLNFTAAVGTLFKDGGLYALLSDSGVYAPNTVVQFLDGKQYGRGIREV